MILTSTAFRNIRHERVFTNPFDWIALCSPQEARYEQVLLV